MPDYTSTAIVSRFKRYVTFPGVVPGYDTADFLDYLNQHLLSVVVPTIIKNREDYFVRSDDFTMPASFDASIQIPTRAVKIRDIKLINSSDSNQMVDIPRIDIEEVTGNNWSSATSRYLNGFMIQGNGIKILNPSNYSGYSVRVYYYNRPGELVQTSEAGLITAIDTLNNKVTVSSVPLTWVVGTKVDFIQGNPGFDIYAVDKAITLITGNDVYFASGVIPSSLAVGDWISGQYTSPVACVPYELWDFLIQGAALKILESQGDMAPGYQMASQKYAQLMAEATSLLSPRVDGEVKIAGSAFTGFL